MALSLRSANSGWAERDLAYGLHGADQLFDGRSFRILTIVDCHTREALAIAPRKNFRAFQVVDVLDQLVRSRGKPQSLQVDNGPEFAGRMLNQWAYLNGVEIDFSRPGKPTEKRRYRGIERARARVPQCVVVPVDGQCPRPDRRMEVPVEDRPHSALGNLTPNALADQASKPRKVA